MKKAIDMSGCVKRDYTTGGRWHRSLCETCTFPLKYCTWLLERKPFAGSEYYEHDVVYWEKICYTVYSIAKCPHYKGEK